MIFEERPFQRKPRVLIVDDEEPVRKLLRRILGEKEYIIEQAGSVDDALAKIAAATPDLVLLDVMMPGGSGHEVLSAIRYDKGTHLIPVVMLTGGASSKDKLRAIDAGVTDFIAKPFSSEELRARVRALARLKFATDALEDAEEVIVAIARILDARDPYTFQHSEHVSFYAHMLAKRIGLGEPEVSAVERGGLFHDLGKIAIRDSVLLKPGKLTSEEYEEIKRHTVEGRDLLSHMKTLAASVELVHHHHEKLDGSGYPEGLSGNEIPVTARITSIADVYDALTTRRVYRDSFPRQKALQIMEEEVQKGWWDGDLFHEFRKMIESGETPSDHTE